MGRRRMLGACTPIPTWRAVWRAPGGVACVYQAPNRAAQAQQPSIGGNQEGPAPEGLHGPITPSDNPVADSQGSPIAGSSRFAQVQEVNSLATAAPSPSPRKRGKMASQDNQK
ncbi:uncharacterized protein PGTG_11995 [Puccinia graminis f. sp. tritici CRL 75-36-700-3]|uniref:Uncharacterized protein n=1 Tax=Puccinia graminis f. sp. tritici (strain CRL 75-36-700-3 / race SCCL) TaxID=418459 RepID=E3KP14_PUCGT|nr:uncharacterized protein PGTG_11995 [Puccinia graminis f. sp. tritici CRL 75-36-700-3]EFP86039.2 hypothetical protein PGTG_11995 [Puccinia graminis f. sp. tritici CRL 75-36-700-3]